LEDFSEQLLAQFGDNDRSSGSINSDTEHDPSAQSNTNIAHQGKLTEKHSQKENDGSKKLLIGNDKETAKKRSSSSKKDPVENPDTDDDGDIPDVYFLSKLCTCIRDTA
jgi:hypothetical protein